ncbi:MAG: hypothetical protein V1727_03915 [Candidatus Omnitrophota bacterium]
MERIKYRVDEKNSLVIERAEQELYPTGEFVIDKNNKLCYILEEPLAWRKKYRLPHKITFEGKWSINEEHDLLFTLNQARRQFGGAELYLKTELVGAEQDALVFSLGTTQESAVHQISLMQLKGRWQSDEYNRLQFLVQKSGSRYDVLTLQGSWDIDPNNTLVYTYRKTYLKRKGAQERTLALKGYWQISAKNRLGYILDLENDSLFSFKAHLETPSILGKRGAIQYRAGIGVKTRPPFTTRTFTLYGIWKLEKKLGLSFEMDYGDGQVAEMRFGAVVQILKHNEITFQLKNTQGQDLGMSVSFSRTVLQEKAEWFLRLMSDRAESRVEGGITILW